jgi:ribosomal protein L40E
MARGASERKVVTGRRICAWCGADLGPAATERNTHGICRDCAEREWTEFELAEVERLREEAP